MSDAASQFNDLITTLKKIAAPATTEPFTFGDTLDSLGHNAYTLTAILAILPFLQPIPLGIFALVGSAAFIALGLQLYKGEASLALPQKIRRVTLSSLMRQALVNTCLIIFRSCRKYF